MNERSAKVTVGIPTYNRSGLLRTAIESVLAQSVTQFQLVISDNASSDDTEATVMSFRDPRIHYTRTDRNIGMSNNFNRIIELANTEFLVILPDDDLLRPDYLASVVPVLERYDRVGVIHTGFDLIDGNGDVVERGKMLLETREPLTIETGDQFLDRSMRQAWTLCWSSALFRRDAVVAAGGLPIEAEPLGDIPLYMKLALDWDFACIARSLVAFRIHAETASEVFASESPLSSSIFEIRMRFLETAALPASHVARYRAIAAASLRSDTIETMTRLANRAGSGAGWWFTIRTLAEIVRNYPRTLLLPVTWKLLAAHFGGRYARHLSVRLLGASGRDV